MALEYLKPQLRQDLMTAITSDWVPPVDVYETEIAFVVQMELPGVRPEDVCVRYANGTLAIWGVRRDRSAPEKIRCLQVEIGYGRFQREIPLDKPIDPQRIQIHHESGFLKVVLPKP